jgi:hypothetical protein
MATLGNQTTGFTFSISGSYGDVAGGYYTVPSPGILVSQLHAYADNNGTSDTARLYVWVDSSSKPGAWLIRSGTFALPSSFAWSARTDLSGNSGQGIGSDLYLPAGTKVWIGYYSSTGKSAFQGDGGSGTTELGNTADGNWSDHGPATSGQGQLAAYLTYTALPAPTISDISPSVAPAGTDITVTGTGFLHASDVTIGGVSASFTVTDDTSITATVPTGVGGVVSCVVTNPAGSDSMDFTAGQIYNGSSGSVQSLVAVKVGVSGAVHDVLGVYVSDGAGGVKRIW